MLGALTILVMLMVLFGPHTSRINNVFRTKTPPRDILAHLERWLENEFSNWIEETWATSKWVRDHTLWPRFEPASQTDSNVATVKLRGLHFDQGRSTLVLIPPFGTSNSWRGPNPSRGNCGPT